MDAVVDIMEVDKPNQIEHVRYVPRKEDLLEQIPETDCYVFLNPKTGAPYQLHELYYLHKRILKQAGLPWVAFRNLQRQCMEVGV